MVTTASSADPQSYNNINNHPSSSSSSMAQAQQHQHQQEDDEERENPKFTSSLKLPQRSRTTNITTSKFNTTTNTNNILPEFSSLPCFTVKWGRQFRCVTGNSNRSPPPSHHDDDDIHNNNANDNDDDDGRILAMRDKLMLDFRTQVQQIQADFIHHTHNNTHQINDDFNTNTNTNTNHKNIDTSTNDNGDKRPWNLRTRRAVCKDPNGTERKPTSSPVKFTEPTQSPLKPNAADGDSEVLPSSSRTRRKKFSASLSKKEIDEDFIAMGTWPAKRPKKRPKLVQRQIDGVFPGYWLSEITAKMYKVTEHP